MPACVSTCHACRVCGRVHVHTWDEPYISIRSGLRFGIALPVVYRESM